MPGAPQQQQKKSITLFASKPKEPGVDVTEINNQMNNLSLRLRVLEERYTNMRRKTQMIEQNMLSNQKTLKDDIKLIDSDMTELKREVIEMNNKFRQLIMELRNCAQKEEVNLVKKYVEMWEPVNFVSANQVEKIVKEEIEQYMAKKGK